MKKYVNFLLCCTLFFYAMECTSCSKENRHEVQAIDNLPEIQGKQKNHTWYYFTDSEFLQTDLPQHAAEGLERAWTESVRIASAASVPVTQTKSGCQAYALVNHLGLMTFTDDRIELFTDASIFSGVTSDSLVFSGETPVFYLYRSTFFNKALEEKNTQSGMGARSFLVEYDSAARVFFPLVTYQNMRLSDDDQIIGFFWDGTTWACASKKILDGKVEFSYFDWMPNIDITKLSPALSSAEVFTFRESSEEVYRSLTMPRAISSAPEKLRTLLAAIPGEFTFTVYWRDTSGTSPVQYFQQGSGSIPLTAHGAEVPLSDYAAVIFADGTTYISRESGTVAFRLPLLPAGYTYGDFCIAGDFLYVSWEQSSFYKTGRSGFIQVDLNKVLASVK